MKKFGIYETVFPFIVTPVKLADKEEFDIKIVACIVATYMTEEFKKDEFKIKTEDAFNDTDMINDFGFGLIKPYKKTLLKLEMCTLQSNDVIDKEIKEIKNLWISNWKMYAKKDTTITSIFYTEMFFNIVEAFAQGKLKNNFKMLNTEYDVVEGVEILKIKSAGVLIVLTRELATLAVANFRQNISVFDTSSKLDFNSIKIFPSE